MALADDLVLLAVYAVGLHRLIDHTTTFLFSHHKNTASDKRHLQHQRPVAASANPRRLPDSTQDLVLGRVMTTKIIRRAAELLPLASSQRSTQATTATLRSKYYSPFGAVLPHHFYRMVRAIIKQWLALPNGTPIGYFHAPIG